jgi:hypothetical protein
MALKIVNPYTLQANMALYSDKDFDLDGFKEIKCTNRNMAMIELSSYRDDAKVIATYTGNCMDDFRPMCIKLTEHKHWYVANKAGTDEITRIPRTYVVFRVSHVASIVKDFILSGDLENVIDVSVATNNTVIYSTSTIASNIPFFTSWFPMFLARYSEVKVYVQVNKASSNLSLTYTRGLLPLGIVNKMADNLTIGVNPATDKTPSSTSTSKYEPPVKGYSVPPYQCVLYKDQNIAGNKPERPGHILADHYTKDATSLGTVEIQCVGYLDYSDMGQFGQAHRNIIVTTTAKQCQVRLALNDVIYYTKELQAGTTLIHDIPIIHAPHTSYAISLLDNDPTPRTLDSAIKTTIQWDALELKEDPTKFEGKVVVPEFNMYMQQGAMMVKRLVNSSPLTQNSW